MTHTPVYYLGNRWFVTARKSRGIRRHVIHDDASFRHDRRDP